jgi:predicted transcriptional regulator
MIEFDLLTKVVEDVSGTSKEKLLSKSRPRPLVELRMICSNALKENNKLTVEKIGNLLNVNHATISYHLKTHKALLVQRDGKYKEMYEKINNKYKLTLALSGENVKFELIEKREKLQKMIKEIDLTLKLIKDNGIE